MEAFSGPGTGLRVHILLSLNPHHVTLGAWGGGVSTNAPVCMRRKQRFPERMSLIPKSHLFKVMRCCLLVPGSLLEANEGQPHRTWKTLPGQGWGEGLEDRCDIRREGVRMGLSCSSRVRLVPCGSLSTGARLWRAQTQQAHPGVHLRTSHCLLQAGVSRWEVEYKRP